MPGCVKTQHVHYLREHKVYYNPVTSHPQIFQCQKAALEMMMT